MNSSVETMIQVADGARALASLAGSAFFIGCLIVAVVVIIRCALTWK